MERIERHHRAQELPGAPEIHVAIHGVDVCRLDECRDYRNRVATHDSLHSLSSKVVVCRASMRSAWVGTPPPPTRLPGALIRGPPCVLAAAASSIPSHAASWHTRSRIAGARSPVPPGHPLASRPAKAG